MEFVDSLRMVADYLYSSPKKANDPLGLHFDIKILPICSLISVIEPIVF